MRRDYKNRAGRPIGDVDNAQVPAAARLPDRDSGTLPARAVFDRAIEDILYFAFVDGVVMNVRLARCRIDVVTSVHPLMLLRTRRWPRFLALARCGPGTGKWCERMGGRGLPGDNLAATFSGDNEDAGSVLSP